MLLISEIFEQGEKHIQSDNQTVFNPNLRRPEEKMIVNSENYYQKYVLLTTEV